MTNQPPPTQKKTSPQFSTPYLYRSFEITNISAKGERNVHYIYLIIFQRSCPGAAFVWTFRRQTINFSSCCIVWKSLQERGRKKERNITQMIWAALPGILVIVPPHFLITCVCGIHASHSFDREFLGNRSFHHSFRDKGSFRKCTYHSKVKYWVLFFKYSLLTTGFTRDRTRAGSNKRQAFKVPWKMQSVPQRRVWSQPIRS